jgi:hypothetical protein
MLRRQKGSIDRGTACGGECVGFDFLAAGEHTSAAQKKPTKCAACSPTKCEKTEWMWATNLPTAQASTASV